MRTNLTDMTQGSPTRHLIVFSLPLLVGNLFQQLYNMVDSIVVGRFVGETALAAVGTAFPVVFLMASLFMGLGTGAMIMISQYYGAGDFERVKATIDTIYTGLMVGAIPLSVVGVLLAKPVMQLLAVPEDAQAECWLYMAILLGGLIGSLGYNANAGILQGVGDSRTPLLFLALACVANIVLDLLLVIVLPLGVAGVAIATVIAQTGSWLFGVVYINKKYPQLHIRPFSLRFDRALFGKVLRLGIPSGIQQALFSFGVMAMLRLINSYGSSFMAGFNGANKVDTLVFMPVQSMANATTTFVGQNIGAGRLDRVKRGTRSAILLSLGLSLVGAAVVYPLSGFCMRLFSSEPAVIASGVAYLHRAVPFFWLLALSFTLNAVMRGAGEMKMPLLSSMVGLWLARIPAAYLLAHFFGPENIHFCYAIGWAAGLVIAVPCFLGGRWKHKSVVQRPADAPQSDSPSSL